MRSLPVVLLTTVSLAAGAAPVNVEDCVRIALERSQKVRVARADVAGLRAQAAAVEGLLSFKFNATSYVAPIYGAVGGFGLTGAYDSDPTQWGPWVHAEGQLVKPLSTFGRYDAGVEAANERVAIEEEKVREIASNVRLEVRRLYGLRLFAASMKPSLDNGAKMLGEAVEKAQEMYDEGGGEISMPELMKLKYAALEISRFVRQSTDGVSLASLALKQAMGLAPDEALELTEDRLPGADWEPRAYEGLLAEALESRPELQQLAHGRKATKAWAEAESKATRPVAFAAAAGQYNWSPVRPKDHSAIGFNTFNDWFVGVALGLQFNIDGAQAGAKTDEALAKAEWVEANAAYAATGIPLQVYKARLDYKQHQELAKVAEEQVTITRKWMTFAGAAYGSGTGEAKDVLEGVGAHLMAKKTHYEHLLGAWQARAELEQAIGAK